MRRRWRAPYTVEGRRLKSEPLSCGLTTHLRVAGNFGSRGRAQCGFSTASSPPIYFYSPSPPLYRGKSIVKGCSRVLRRAGRKKILKQGGNCLSSSRAEIFLPRARRVSCVSETERGKEDAASSDASPDTLGLSRRGLISG